MTSLRQRMLEDMQVRRLSPFTQRTYVETVARFARYFDRSPERLGPEQVRAYQVYLATERRLATSSLLVAVAALRFLYRVTLRKRWSFDDVIPAPKKPQSLPVVLSPQEVVVFLDAVKAAKHRAILTTCYAAGLRISEAVRLTVSAIDSQRMVLRITEGKGQKDRYVMLSPKLLAVLRAWWKVERPRHWLFPGERPETPITVDGAPLDLRASLAVRNPSPTGPAWGYGGSGPTQLALAILLAVTDEATAERFYQPFPWSVIAPIEADRWALDAGDVLGGLEVGSRLGRTTSCTWRWTKVVRAGCLGTQRICPAAVRPPCRSSPLRAAPRLFPVFVRRTRPWRASSSCGFRRRASGVAAGRFRGPSSGLQVDFEHAWGRGTLPVDEDPGARDGRAGSPTGPSQLALAILLPATDEATAERFYQPFQGSVIARASSPCRAASETPIARARSRRPSATPRRRRCAASASNGSTSLRRISTAGSGAGPIPRIHGTTKRQVAAMFAEEHPALGPLPLEPFRYYQYGRRTVHLDGGVEVASAYYRGRTWARTEFYVSSGASRFLAVAWSSLISPSVPASGCRPSVDGVEVRVVVCWSRSCCWALRWSRPCRDVATRHVSAYTETRKSVLSSWPWSTRCSARRAAAAKRPSPSTRP